MSPKNHRYESSIAQFELIPQPVEDGKKTRVDLPVAGSGNETNQPPTDTKPREIEDCWNWVK